MKICVVGLGLIGGSMGLALKSAGHSVYGFNRSKDVYDYALSHGVIDGVATDFSSYDVVFVALPFKPTLDFILTTAFKQGAIVADICGVKEPIERAVLSANLPIRYVGTHPMAGKEVSSIYNACNDLFKGASMVICSNEQTDKGAVETIKNLTADMLFGRIVECTAKVHDKKIAYTSQLAHVVSNCYVKDDEIESCLGFTGGSFQDMTRIAGVDENMWSSLYLANDENLLEKLQKLIDNLSLVKDAVQGGDEQVLRQVLKDGRARYQDSKSRAFSSEHVKTTVINKGE